MKWYWAVAVLMLCFLSSVNAEDAITSQPLTIHLFYSPTCAHCHSVRALVNKLVAQNPSLGSVEHNLSEPENIELMADYYTRYQVPPEQWGGTIALFVGDRWWNDTDKILIELGPAINSMTIAGPSEQQGQGRTALRELFESFGVLTVAVAGLLDGINPCAMATLVFLISYLTFAQRSPKEVLATGLLFATGIFVAYLAVGLGAFRALQMMAGFTLASRLLYPAMALGTAILSGYSFRDYLRAKAGAVSDMTLKLPRGLTRLSHGLIRSSLRVPTFLGFAFVAGLLISILELFCTGQIYLPTLMYMWSTETLRMRSLQLLVLYVAMFTLPIVALTVVAYAGVSSEKLTRFARRNTAAVKLAITVLFAILTIYLGTVSVHLFVG